MTKTESTLSAAIAQLVERLTSNQEVSSSNLGGGFNFCFFIHENDSFCFDFFIGSFCRWGKQGA